MSTSNLAANRLPFCKRSAFRQWSSETLPNRNVPHSTTGKKSASVARSIATYQSCSPADDCTAPRRCAASSLCTWLYTTQFWSLRCPGMQSREASFEYIPLHYVLSTGKGLFELFPPSAGCTTEAEPRECTARGLNTILLPWLQYCTSRAHCSKLLSLLRSYLRHCI